MDELPGLEIPRHEARAVQVLLETPLPHLDQHFDYALPDGVEAPLGCRVKVRFGGRQQDAFVVGHAPSQHAGRLLPITKVVSPLSVLTPEVLELCADVAHAMAGSTPDVVRLAVPARAARVELAANLEPGPMPVAPEADLPTWGDYEGGERFLEHVRRGELPRAVWSALPGVVGEIPRWQHDLRAAVGACLASGRRVLIVVPTISAVESVSAVLGDLGSVVQQHGELTPPDRYRVFLRALSGQCDIVVGTRSAVYAPVPDLGLIVIWDCDDENLFEQHAPYPTALHAVVRRRKTAVLIGSLSRPVRAQLLVHDAWAKDISPARATFRAAAARVDAPDESALRGDRSRLPEAAFRMLRGALEHGPVLIHTPRSGYLHAIRCAECGESVRCPHCNGPITITPGGTACTWCGRLVHVRCAECGGTAVKAYRVGAERTWEEIGRQFPSVPVVLSNARAGITRVVGPQPRVVIATPGSEPVAEGGYAAAAILDAAVATARPDLDAGLTAVGRWFHVAGLVRSAGDGGRVMILGGPERRAADAVVRWDAAGYAARELEEREELHFPPAWRTAKLTGEATDLDAVGAKLEAELLGPVDGALIVRVPRREGRELLDQLRAITRERSAKKLAKVNVRVDAPL